MTERPSTDHIWSSLQNALVIIDPEHQIVDLNPAAEHIFGTSAKHLLGKAIGAELRFDDQRLNAVLLDEQANLAARNVPVWIRKTKREIDFTINTLASDPHWRLISLSILPESYFAHDQDVSSDNHIGVRAPDVLGHEIKNPLAAIRGAAQLLARSLDEDHRSHTTMITSEVDRIVKLLDRMQSLSASQPAKLAAVNVHTLINRVRQSIEAANDGRITITDQFDPSLPDALIDSDYMMQILTNVLANAIDAVQKVECPKIEILTRFSFGASFSAKGSNQTIRLPIEIVIRDNGPGIAAKLENEIFSPFVSTKTDGQGLGLALVKKLMTDMSGRVKYDRKESSGLTQFTLYLPMAIEGRK